MFKFLKNLLSSSPAANYKEMIEQGGQIIDVRSPQEFQSGHIHGAINIPLQTIDSQLNKISKDRDIILCCASGMRSASATSKLKSKGYTKVYNGGGWSSLNQKLR